MDVAPAVVGGREDPEAALVLRRALKVGRTRDQFGDRLGEKVDDLARQLEAVLRLRRAMREIE
ncbi:hypothetical protein QA634_14315 [Methylobacterium sp. CB376]|uniref:hypothetical protein n=1 Tax=unclassified Methylobacterium TaxID=2615210 RepID=UPI00036E3A56|nr:MULTISPECIES: hypothetical protein [Methylobacterium]WFT82935.1 hypothetical protein QA634_14315 [Methylobacterium nodulans]